jgi:hypothetical protein
MDVLARNLFYRSLLRPLLRINKVIVDFVSLRNGSSLTPGRMAVRFGFQGAVLVGAMLPDRCKEKGHKDLISG